MKRILFILLVLPLFGITQTVDYLKPNLLRVLVHFAPPYLDTTSQIYVGEMRTRPSDGYWYQCVSLSADKKWQKIARYSDVSGGGMTNPLTTTGDIIYSSSGTTAARLGIGSTNDVLTIIGGVPSWQAPSGGVGSPGSPANSVQVNVSSAFSGSANLLAALTHNPLKITSASTTDTALVIVADASQAIHNFLIRKADGTPRFAITKNGAINTYGGSNDGRLADGGVMDYDVNNEIFNIKAVTVAGGDKTIGFESSNIVFASSASNWAKMNITGLFLGGVSSPTARLHLAAGTTSPSTAAIKATDGNLMTTAEAGAIERQSGLYDTKASGLRMAMTGVIADFYTDAGNTSTTETDLYSYTTPANTLAADGEKITGDFMVSYVANVVTKVVKLYFAGTVIFNFGNITSTIGSVFKVDIIRTSSSSVRWIVWDGKSISDASYGDLTGLTLSGTNIIKITGTSAVGATNDIIARWGKISWQGVAVN